MKPFVVVVALLAIFLGALTAFIVHSGMAAGATSFRIGRSARCLVNDGDPSYLRAGWTVCFHGSATPADPLTFRDLGGGFGRDWAHVYWMGSVILADPSSFVVLPSAPGHDLVVPVYSADRNYVYLSDPDADPPFGLTEIIEGADPTTIEILLGDESHAIGYAKDGDQVWYFGREVVGADPATFQLLELGNSVDAADDMASYAGGQSL